MRLKYDIGIIFLFALVSCERIRPDEARGPVIAERRIVSAAVFQFNVSDPYSQRTMFVRYVHYFVRPNQWSAISSGDAAPVTLFEDAAVYYLQYIGPENRPAVTRLFKIPEVRTDGIKPPRFHLSFPAPVPANPDQAARRNGMVYLENGPIYGGFDPGIEPSFLFQGDREMRLFVDAQVYRAAMASDGETIAYVDAEGWLNVVNPGKGPPAALIDLRAALGPASVVAIQWGESFNQVWIRIDKGTEEQVWATSTIEPALARLFINPAFVPAPSNPGLIETVENLTRDFTPEAWGIPAPESFSP